MKKKRRASSTKPSLSQQQQQQSQPSSSPHIDKFDFNQPGFIERYYENTNLTDRFMHTIFKTPRELHDIRMKVVQSDTYREYLASKVKPNKSYWHRHVVRATFLTIPTIIMFQFINWTSRREQQQLMENRADRETFEPFVVMDQMTAYEKIPSKDVRETVGVNREKFYSNRELARLKFEEMSMQQSLSEMNEKINALKMKKEQQQLLRSQQQQHQEQQSSSSSPTASSQQPSIPPRPSAAASTTTI